MKIESVKSSCVLDTTGAGDIYAGGFLYGYTTGRDLLTCGKIGSICAGNIITHFGSRAQTSQKELLKTYL